jgi:hypothetical protein
MKRFRLGTLMLLIVIAALVVALAVQQQRAARREAELQARQVRLEKENSYLKALVNRYLFEMQRARESLH